MSGGMNRSVAAAAAAVALLGALAAPSVASASCNGRPSAANVYSECLAGSGNHTHGGKSSGSNSSNPTQTTTPSSQTTTPISSQTAKPPQHTKHRRVLSSLAKGYGVARLAEPSTSTSEPSNPTAIGSAFDLGAGPTALLLVLVGTAVVLLGGSGMRVWRSRHRQ